MNSLIPMPKETLNRCRNMALNLLLELDETSANKFVMKIRAKYSNSFEPAHITAISLSYQSYRLYHDFYQNEQGNWIAVNDETYKGYCFTTDYNWRFPVPLPSAYEVLPLPNFTNDPPTVQQSCTLSSSGMSVSITLTNPETLVEIGDLPCGVYQISVSTTNRMGQITYYPDYYNNYSAYVDRSKVQIDRSGNLSGFSMQSQYAQVSPYQPIGYDFYCITDKFANKIVDVVGERLADMKYVFTWIDIPNFTNVTFTNEHILPSYQRTMQKGLAVKIYEENNLVGTFLLGGFTLRKYADGNIAVTLSSANHADFNEYLEIGYMMNGSEYTYHVKNEYTMNISNCSLANGAFAYDWQNYFELTNLITGEVDTNTSTGRESYNIDSKFSNVTYQYNEKWAGVLPSADNTEHKYYYCENVVLLPNHTERESLNLYLMRASSYPQEFITAEFNL